MVREAKATALHFELASGHCKMTEPTPNDEALADTFVSALGLSAPELFQRQMRSLLNGMPGVVCLMDDVLIFGKSHAEHDTHLEAVLKRLITAGVTLNPSFQS